MKTKLTIGCSAFNNDYWKGHFYPEDLPRSKFFAYYAQHFNTYEINATFYSMPTVKSLRSWYDKVGDDFAFSVKAHRSITHYKKFNNCAAEIAEFYAIVREGLGAKLGGILFQMPPSFAYSPEKMQLVVEALDDRFQNIVEFRHQSWWRADVFEALAQRNIVFCSVSYPNLPETLIANTDVGYIRLHGKPKLFYSNYSDAELSFLLAEISSQRKWKQAFVYFNNTADVHGVLDALQLQKLSL